MRTVQTDIHGIGSVDTITEYTSTDIQTRYVQIMADIFQILDRSNQGKASAADFDKLMADLKALEDLAKNGMVAPNGITYYLTTDMAHNLDQVLTQFEKVGLTPGMDTSKLSSQDKIDLLNKTKTSDPTTDPLVKAVAEGMAFKYEDKTLQGMLVPILVGQAFGAAEANLNDLYDMMDVTKSTTDALNNLMEVGSHVSVEGPYAQSDWNAPLPPTNIADIPPDAVPKLYEEMKKYDSKAASNFIGQYNDAYTEAVNKARAANGGATPSTEQIQAQMRAGDQSAFNTLKKTMNDKMPYSNYVKIVTDVKVQEIKPNYSPVPGDDKLILDSYNTLKANIKTLTDMGADPDMIASLQKIVDHMDSIIGDFLPAGKTMDTATPEEQLSAIQSVQHWAERGTHYLTDPGPSGKSLKQEVSDAVTVFQKANGEQEKNLEQQMTYIEQLTKMIGELMKTIDDAVKRVSGNISRN